MILPLLKLAVPDRPLPCRILRGPFRGAAVRLNPRQSLRKILGLYEHELNDWLRAALPRAAAVYDVGANDGYFTFGCAAAFARLGRPGRVFAFEPGEAAFQTLVRSAERYNRARPGSIELVNRFVGGPGDPAVVSLDDFLAGPGGPRPERGVLVKIDVEGAEVDVLRGAERLLQPDNLFVVEVHSRPLLTAVTELFGRHGVPVETVSQRPLPVLGREHRDVDNWWVVSRV